MKEGQSQGTKKQGLKEKEGQKNSEIKIQGNQIGENP